MADRPGRDQDYSAHALPPPPPPPAAPQLGHGAPPHATAGDAPGGTDAAPGATEREALLQRRHGSDGSVASDAGGEEEEGQRAGLLNVDGRVELVGRQGGAGADGGKEGGGPGRVVQAALQEQGSADDEQLPRRISELDAGAAGGGPRRQGGGGGAARGKQPQPPRRGAGEGFSWAAFRAWAGQPRNAKVRRG